MDARTTLVRRVRISGLTSEQAIDLAHAWGQPVEPGGSDDDPLGIFYILDEHRNIRPGSLDEWRDQMKDVNARRVGYDEVATPDGIAKVSTVFLGIDHGFGRREFFETMVFGGKYHRRTIARYASWPEAERGHKVVANRLKVGITLDDLDE